MRRIIFFFANNIVINHFLIWIGCDHLIKKYINNWTIQKLNPNKTLQENVGFSHHQMIDEAIQKVQNYVIETERTYVPPDGNVLDIGCGVGLYMKNLKSNNIFGIDLSKSFLEECQRIVPTAKTSLGNYLEIEFEKGKFDYIYSISVIEYVPPSKIKKFIEKTYNELKNNGILLIQYPHAMSYKDKWYADLSYISYMPSRIEQIVKKYFDILIHEHCYDKRKVSGIDKVNYSPNKNLTRFFCNGMILIARKKANANS